MKGNFQFVLAIFNRVVDNVRLEWLAYIVFNKVHNAIDLDNPVESDDLVKVISPMYGSSIPGYKPVDKIPVKQPDPNVTPEEPEAIDLSDMLEKTKDTVAHQEKLFASKN